MAGSDSRPFDELVEHDPGDAPPDDPDGGGRTRPTRLHFGFIGIVGAILVVVPTLLYIGLSSSPSVKDPRPLSPAKVVSYYPPTAAWAYMWTRYDGEQIASDLQRAHRLGFDTVRIFIPPKAFGFPVPSEQMQSRLRDVIAAAAAAHLRVGLSLFDRFENYPDQDGSAVWLRAILKPYADDRRIAFIEPHNEIDPSNSTAVSWFRRMLALTREASRAPIIASVSGRLGVPGLRSLATKLARTPPDAYSLHYYSDPAYLEATLHRAQQAVSPVRLVLGEVGYSTAASNPATTGAPATAWAQEAQQSVVLRAAFDATRRLAMPAPGIWTLFDVAPGAIPPDVSPGMQEQARRYGLLRVDGSPKPAAADVAEYLVRNAISDDFNADFTHGGSSSTGPQPADWRTFDPRDGSLTWDSAVGHDAPGSVRLARTQGSAGRVPSYYQPIWSVEIRPHQAYHLSAWARGRGLVGNDRIAVSWFDANGRYLRQRESKGLPHGNPGWTHLTLVVNPPHGAAVLELHLKSSHENGSVWFDDVSVR